MITLHQLKVYRGARKKRKVIGRGLGSGHGTYSTRGAKGQRARKSGNAKPGFEGGRQPLIRQLPKSRGFKSQHPKAVAVSITRLNKFNDGDVVTVQSLLQKGIIKPQDKVKLVAGELKKKLEVHLKVSASARSAIEKMGGKVL